MKWSKKEKVQAEMIKTENQINRNNTNWKQIEKIQKSLNFHCGFSLVSNTNKSHRWKSLFHRSKVWNTDDNDNYNNSNDKLPNFSASSKSPFYRVKCSNYRMKMDKE